MTREADPIGLGDKVALGSSEAPSQGRVVAIGDGGKSLYVHWQVHTRCGGTVTMERAADLQKLGDTSSAS